MMITFLYALLYSPSGRPFGQLQNEESFANYSWHLQRFVAMLLREQHDLRTPYGEVLEQLLANLRERYHIYC